MHGASLYRSRTPCRCNVCREDHRLRHRAERAARYGRRVWVNGNLTIVDPDVRHGLQTTYSNWGCRCDECRAANAADSLKIRERRKEKRA